MYPIDINHPTFALLAKSDDNGLIDDLTSAAAVFICPALDRYKRNAILNLL